MNVSEHTRTCRRFSIIGLLLALACFWAPAANAQSCNGTGSVDGDLFYTHWSNSSNGAPCIQFGGRGNYYYSWQYFQGNFVGGKGWSGGNLNKVIGYNATFQPNGNAYLAFYGWAKSNDGEMVEYYIIDSWGTWEPPFGNSPPTPAGYVNTDGGTYKLYKKRVYGQPHAFGPGNADFDQYWSVRTSKRQTSVNSTITLANHVNAWANLGWTLGGEKKYQVMGTEGYGDAQYPTSGYSNVTVWEEGGSSGGYEPLINKLSSKAIDVKDKYSGNGGLLQQYDYWGSSNQKWKLVRGRLPDTWEVRTEMPGNRCVGVPWSSKAPGTQLIIFDCNGNTDQLWYQLWVEDHFRLQNVNSNLCMEVRGLSTDNFAVIQQHDCDWDWNQRWRTWR